MDAAPLLHSVVVALAEARLEAIDRQRSGGDKARQ